jgi:hypothetical protein
MTIELDLTPLADLVRDPSYGIPALILAVYVPAAAVLRVVDKKTKVFEGADADIRMMVWLFSPLFLFLPLFMIGWVAVWALSVGFIAPPWKR